MLSFSLVFAYFSPETLLPMTSILASATGVFLIFGRSALRVVRRLYRMARARAVRVETIPTPHFANARRSRTETPQ